MYRFFRSHWFLRVTILLISSCILCSMVPMTVAVDSSTTIEYSTYFESPSFSKIRWGTEWYDQIQMENTDRSIKEGAPVLPVRPITLYIPPHRIIKDITYSFGENIKLGSNYRVEPGGTPFSVSYSENQHIPTPNNDIYDSTDIYPSQPVESHDIQKYRGYQVLTLSIYPMTYLPITGELTYYTSIHLTISTQPVFQEQHLLRNTMEDIASLKQKVDNSQDFNDPLTPPAPLEDVYDLLILTTDSLASGFEPLAQTHNSQGTLTEIRTLTDIGGTSPSHIRSYIKDQYQNHSINYVLLGGDYNIIPSQHLHYGKNGAEDVKAPSDIYYGCLDGDFDEDDDGILGEAEDNPDLLAEVYVGRASVETLEEVDAFVHKTNVYLNSNPEYIGRVILLGEDLKPGSGTQWGGDSLDQLIDGSSADSYTTVGIPSDEFQIIPVYEREGPWSRDDLQSIIDSGVYVIDHLGHGQATHAMKLSNDDIESLENSHPCLVYSQACYSGRFDDIDDCVAEAFTVKNNHGAFAAIMNTRQGWYAPSSTDGPSHRYNREFWDALYGENISSIGHALQDSKEDNIYRINEDKMRWCFYEITLFGDPTLQMYDPVPTPSIRFSPIQGGLGLSTTIENTGTAPASNIEYNIMVTGGRFGFVNKNFSDTIDSLAIDDNNTITTRPFVGLGKIMITVSISIDGQYPVKKKYSLYHFGVFSFELPEWLQQFFEG